MKRNLSIDCLLVIDVQDKCIYDCFAHKEFNHSLSLVQETVPSIKTLVNICRKKKIEIVWILTYPWTKIYLKDNIVELYESNPDATFYDTDEKYPEPVLDTKNETIFRKRSYSAFGGSDKELDEYLKKNYYTRLGICGFYSTGCVDRTIAAAVDHGYFNIIFRDCVQTFDHARDEHEERLLHWSRNDGHVTTISEFAHHLL